jgi:serine phosphatase RsbU (regulator of sigma subunit)
MRRPLLQMIVGLGVVGLVLLALAFWVFTAIEGAGAYQLQVRAARVARADVVQLQIDEESGLRGFVGTRQAVFLEPYHAAERRFAAAVAQLQETVISLHAPSLATLPLDEKWLHDQWIAEVAAPLLAKPERPDALLLQLKGKRLIDEFRREDDQLVEGLYRSSLDADQRLGSALRQTVVLGGVAVVTLGLLFALLALREQRLSEAVEEQRRLYEGEKYVADTLQQAFVQARLPNPQRLALHAVYAPADEQARLGGDWYDAFELPDGRVLFSVGDVAGHGIEAVVAMSRARQAIVAASFLERDPAAVLRRANMNLLLQQTGMVTAVCGFIDPASLEVVYATAGHPPPVLAVPGGEARFLAYGGVPLGIESEPEYNSYVAHVTEPTLFVLYTDGLIEFNRDIIDGQARLLEAARHAVRSNADPARAIYTRILSSETALDDVAVLTFSFRTR